MLTDFDMVFISCMCRCNTGFLHSCVSQDNWPTGFRGVFCLLSHLYIECAYSTIFSMYVASGDGSILKALGLAPMLLPFEPFPELHSY